MTSILAFVFVIGVLVFIHEFGHFLLAKLVGIRVERFSLGLPPRMVGKKIGDTDYCISWIPFGGYVKLAGMIDESLDKKSIETQGQPWEFQQKPVYQRAIVILAGPLMNLILAFIVFSGTIFVQGVAQVEGTKVGQLLKGYPAEAAGIKKGDVIVAVDGENVSRWEDMTAIIHRKPNEFVSVEWERDGQRFSAVLKTKRVVQKTLIGPDSIEVGMIGIAPEIQIIKVGPFKSIYLGAEKTAYVTAMVGVAIKRLIIGEESLRSLAGPIFIGKLAGQTAKSGFENLLVFMAILSINFVVINLLPIPVLDGGHLMFLAIEGVARRPVSVRVRLIVQQIGMALIIALIIFILFNDLRNIFSNFNPFMPTNR